MARSKVIKDLASGKVPIDVAMKQLKVLLTDFEKPEILKWVDSELQGYDVDDCLPNYRILKGNLVGNFLNYYTKATHVSIPLSADAPKGLVELCSHVKLYESLSGLKTLISSDEELGMQINALLLPDIQKYSLISMTALLNASVIFSKIQVQDVLSKTENKMMGIFLLLEKEFGNLDEMDIDLSMKTKDELSSISNTIMVTIYNDNSIRVGNDNKMIGTNISTTK